MARLTQLGFASACASTKFNRGKKGEQAMATQASMIPGFGGEAFAPGDPAYDAKRAQYASISYPEKQGPGGTMRPYLVAYPRPNSDDIPAAIRFARANNKRVVARSGGHQYSGMSSGGDDTILLSMDNYSDLEFKAVGDQTFARIGVGGHLTNLAAALNGHGVTMPHGECPRVCIGGHIQSGGYGLLLRSYGLALDHVSEFKIYTADGTLRTVRRPAAQDRNGLFWGVLGGGPGSFGVLTEVTVECLRDVDHPYSSGYQGFFVYEKGMFARAMNEFRVWSEKVASQDPAFPKDVDMQISLIAEKAAGRPVVVIEMINGNKDGRDDGGRNSAFLDEVVKRITGDQRPAPGRGHHTSANFSARDDGNGHVEIFDPSVSNGGSVVASATSTFPHGGIDLPNLTFGAQTTLAYAENNAGTGGTLTVSDGRHAASITLLGNYIAGSFVVAVDGHGSTLVTGAQPREQTSLTPPRA
jgi:hypothetical protein